MTDLKQQHPLKLLASPGAWRMYAARKQDPRFNNFELKILKRDRYMCQFCGFQARMFQDVVNFNNNYANNKPENIVTACCFCAQCFFIESVGVGGFGGGTLIYLPEMTQEALNGLCHVLFCAITNDTGYKPSAQEIYRSFKARGKFVEEKFGEGTSDPAIFGQLMIDTDALAPEKRDALLAGVRLLPMRSKFRKQIEHWAASAIQEASTS